MVKFMSYYPHESGTTVSVRELDETLFCILLAMLQDEEQTNRSETFGDTHFAELVDLIDTIGFDYDTSASRAEKQLYKRLVKKSGEDFYAFYDALTGQYQDLKPSVWRNRILRSFEEKGFIADEFEEGTFAIALPGYEKDAVRAMADMEAKHAYDEVLSYF